MSIGRQTIATCNRMKSNNGEINNLHNQHHVKFEPELASVMVKCESREEDKTSQLMHLPSAASVNVSNKRGSLQLWQFLLHLLNTKTASHNEPIIEWTRKSAAEFKLIDPEEVARLWGVQKNRLSMNYDKLSRSLRYYYEKGSFCRIRNKFTNQAQLIGSYIF